LRNGGGGNLFRKPGRRKKGWRSMDTGEREKEKGSGHGKCERGARTSCFFHNGKWSQAGPARKKKGP